MSVNLREKGGVVVIELGGEIRLTDDQTPSLQRRIGEKLAEGKTDFLIDFSKVDFIDSYGIGDVVASFLAIKDKKGRLKMSGLSPKIWLIFKYSGLTQILEIYDSLEQALRDFV